MTDETKTGSWPPDGVIRGPLGNAFPFQYKPQTPDLPPPDALAPLRWRLRVALEAGILLGVKWGVCLFILGGILLLALGDYAQTKQQAKQGAEAFKYIQDAIQKAAPK